MKDIRDYLASGKTYQDICACLVEWKPPDAPVEQSKQAEQIDTATEQEICRALQIDVLGRLEDGSVKVFSIFHRRSSVIKNPSRMTYEDFLQTCGPPAKACLLKSRVDDGIPGMWGCDDARGAVQILAGYRTLSDEIELGCGCWYADKERETSEGDESHDESIVLVNPSEAAVYNGTLTRVEHPRACGMLLNFSASTRPWYDFDKLSKLIADADSYQFRMEAYRESLELWGRWRWTYQTASPAIISGLVMATWIQHVWTWRPQIAIIGPSKAGKSILTDALAGVFRGNVIVTSDTTAAGLRQEIENSLPAVIVDEADPKERQQQIERRKILAMIRQSSRGGLVLRGSSSQHSVRHTLRHLFWVFGIHLPFDSEADRNRVIMLELKLPVSQDEGKLQLPPAGDLQRLGQRLLAISIWGSRRARALASRIRDSRIEGIDSRIIESYAVPTASLSVMHGFDQDDSSVRELLNDILGEAKDNDQPQPLHDDLMHDILSSRIQIGGERPSVAQCVERVVSLSAGAGEAEVALAACGIRIDRTPGAMRFLAQYKPVSRHLLHNTRWDGAAIDQLLRTIPGAEKVNRRVGGAMGRGISIPWEVVEERYLGSEYTRQEGLEGF